MNSIGVSYGVNISDFYIFGENMNSKNKLLSKDLRGYHGKTNHINDLPSEIFIKIFSCLSFADFRNSCQVSSKWNNQLTSNPHLGKDIVYHDCIAMGPKKFAEWFGNDIIPFKDYERNAYDSLPDNIVRILNKQCLAFPSTTSLIDIGLNYFQALVFGPPTTEIPEKKIGTTHLLFYVHESFTINQLGKLFKKCFPGTKDGYKTLKLLMGNADKPIGKSGWILMINEILLGSRNQWPLEHKKLIVDLASKTYLPYDEADVVSVIVGIMGKFMSSNKTAYLFGENPTTMTRTKAPLQGYETFIGAFNQKGLSIYTFHDYDSVAPCFGTTALFWL